MLQISIFRHLLINFDLIFILFISSFIDCEFIILCISIHCVWRQDGLPLHGDLRHWIHLNSSKTLKIGFNWYKENKIRFVYSEASHCFPSVYCVDVWRMCRSRQTRIWYPPSAHSICFICNSKHYQACIWFSLANTCLNWKWYSFLHLFSSFVNLLQLFVPVADGRTATTDRLIARQTRHIYNSGGLRKFSRFRGHCIPPQSEWIPDNDVTRLVPEPNPGLIQNANLGRRS